LILCYSGSLRLRIGTPLRTESSVEGFEYHHVWHQWATDVVDGGGGSSFYRPLVQFPVEAENRVNRIEY
jgi:hypothetical protein